MDAILQRIWYTNRLQWLSVLLLPLSWLFGVITALRRAAYLRGWARTIRVAKPVIVVGNITAGGTGKTPMTIWLAERLQSRGVRVGIVLRGYGGTSKQSPRDVTNETSAEEVGDEAVLLARRTGALVVAGPDRVAAANRAIERGARVIVCDDGLQHYRLARDLEIAVIDERRGLGNGRLLPAGPLREPPSRLNRVGLNVLTRRTQTTTGAITIPNAIVMTPMLGDAVSLGTGECRSLSSFAGSRVRAIAGIGNPQAFFDALVAAGLTVDPHALPDHVRLTQAHLSSPDGTPVLMTEKDAVKCRPDADSALLANCWAVRLDVTISEAEAEAIDRVLERTLSAH